MSKITEQMVDAFNAAYEAEWERVAELDGSGDAARLGGADRAATVAGLEAAMSQGEAVAWQVRDATSNWQWGTSDKGCYQMVKRHRPKDARALYEHPTAVQIEGLLISEDDRAVLQRIQNALPTVGLNGWHKGVEVLERLLRNSLSQPAPQSDPIPDELAEALAVGDGTIEGALQYWHQRALASEAAQSEPAGGATVPFQLASEMVHQAYNAGRQGAGYTHQLSTLESALAATGKQSGSERERGGEV